MGGRRKQANEWADRQIHSAPDQGFSMGFPSSVLGADEMKPSLHLRSGEGEGPEAGAADMLVSCLCGV